MLISITTIVTGVEIHTNAPIHLLNFPYWRRSTPKTTLTIFSPSIGEFNMSFSHLPIYKSQLCSNNQPDPRIPPLQTRYNNRKPCLNRTRRNRSSRAGAKSPRSPQRAETTWTHPATVGWVSWPAWSRGRCCCSARTFEVYRGDFGLWLIGCTFQKVSWCDGNCIYKNFW